MEMGVGRREPVVMEALACLIDVSGGGVVN